VCNVPAVDLRLDRVAGSQPALQAKGDAARRARGDHLAQMQIELVEAVGNQLGLLVPVRAAECDRPELNEARRAHLQRRSLRA
jgi:hypothetical protein